MPDWNFLLHILTVFTIVGSGLALGILLVLCRIFKITNPRQRIRMLFLALAMPILATGFSYYLRPLWNGEMGPQCVGGFFARLCPLGKLGSTYYLPLVFLLVFGFYRTLMYCLYQFRLVRWTEMPDSASYPHLFPCLKALVEKANMAMPQVRVINKPAYGCFTYGFFRPTIVISQALLGQLNYDELEAVLAHELGHIHHRDSFWKEVGAIFRDLGFYLPFVHWNWRLLRNEQELAADDFAVSLTEKPLLYGMVLIAVWRNQQPANGRFSAASAFAGDVRVSERVTRVIDEKGSPGFGGLPYLVLFLGWTMVVILSFVC